MSHQNNTTFPISCILISACLMMASIGINLVAFPAVLSAHGVRVGLIGFSSFVDITAGMCAAFLLTKVVYKIGAMNAVLLSTLIFSSSVLVIYFFGSYPLWLFLCALIGATRTAMFVIRMSWLNMLVSDKNRSVIIGASGTITCVGLFIGALMGKIMDAEGYSIFILSAALFFASYLVLIPIRKLEPKKIAAERIGLRQFFRDNPRCFMAKLLLEIQFFCILSFTVIFGRAVGFATGTAALLLCAFLASGLLDIVVGVLLKKYNGYRMIFFGFIGGLTCFLIASTEPHFYYLLLAIYFIFGIFFSFVFIATSTLINNFYPTEKLLAANAAFNAIALIGGIIGSLACSVLMEIFGFKGFLLLIIACNALYLLFIAIYSNLPLKRGQIH